MGAIGNKFPNILDVLKKTDPDGSMADVGEVLEQTNEIVQDIPFFESNLPTGNRVTLRSSLPSVGFSKIYQGIPQSKGSTRQVVDTIGLINGMSEVDARLKHAAGGNFPAIRRDEDLTFIESMGQLAALTMVYGNEATNEASFTGLTPRFNSLSGEYGSQIVDGLGTGSDNTSIWIVDWHPRYVHGIYPKGSTAGLTQDDMGKCRVTDADGNPYSAFVTQFDWALGLTVKHKKHVARVANIDVSDLANSGKSGYTGPDLTLFLIDALHKLDPINGAQRAIYCNETIAAAFDKQVTNKANVYLTLGEFAGQPVTMFRGIPIRRVDKIADNEARVV